MAIVNWPAALVPGPGSGFGQRRFDLSFASETTGAQQDRILAPPRWQLSLAAPESLSPALAGQWQAVIMALRGRVNHLQAWDFGRAQPLGTARGVMTLGASAAAGATTVTLAGVTGANLLLAPNALDNAAWSGFAIVTPNTDAAAVGVGTTADTLTDSSNTGRWGRDQSVQVVDDATPYTASVYVKKTTGGTSPTFGLFLSFTGGAVAVNNNPRFNTDTGETVGGIGTGVVTDAGDYWRFSSTLQNNASGHTQVFFSLSPATALHGEFFADVTAQGSAVVSQAQLERGTVPSDSPAPATLLPGDLLQIGTGLGTQQVVMVTAAAQADELGAMAVTFEPPLRVAHSLGAAVQWDKPAAFFKMTTSASAWQYQPTQAGPWVNGLSLDLLEHWQ